jgi:hypothetical protein
LKFADLRFSLAERVSASLAATEICVQKPGVPTACGRLRRRTNQPLVDNY